MSEVAVRLGLIATVVVVSLVAALIARRTVAIHPPVAIEGLGFGTGLVVFTSTDCVRCKEALAAAKATGLPMREVTYELEPGLLERAGVTGVPLTLVLDEHGQLVAQLAGVRHRALRRAASRVGGPQFHRGANPRR